MISMGWSNGVRRPVHPPGCQQFPFRIVVVDRELPTTWGRMDLARLVTVSGCASSCGYHHSSRGYQCCQDYQLLHGLHLSVSPMAEFTKYKHRLIWPRGQQEDRGRVQLCQTGPGWGSGGFARVARTVCRLWDGQGAVLPRKCTSIAELPLAGALFIVIGPPRPCQHS